MEPTASGAPADPLVAVRTRAWENLYWRYLGVEVDDAKPGWVRLRVPVGDELRNAAGAPVHGGVMSTLVDMAVGGALGTLIEASAGGVGQTTLDLNVSFLSAATTGPIFAEGRILRRGRTVAFGEANITDATGRLCAVGRATYMNPGAVRVSAPHSVVKGETSMAIPIVLSPPMPKPILELAHGMLPAGFELRVLEQQGPEFFKGLTDAQYFTGFARTSLGPDFYRAAPQLKLVQLISAGYDRCDLAAARQANVPIANNGGANSIAVAEHTLTLILSVLKRLAWLHANVTAGKWRVGDFAENRVYELYGKTVGIVGLGVIGKKVARRLHGFDVEIIYHDVVRLTEDQEEALGVKFRLLDELLSVSDIVTLHVPLTSLTRNMMDARTLGKMKESAILINTCRGPVVDEEALFQALTTKRLGAAGLDVMEQEPPPADHKFFNLPNMILTPHMAGPTWENWTRIFRNAFDNIQRVAAGRPPLWVIPELRDL